MLVLYEVLSSMLAMYSAYSVLYFLLMATFYTFSYGDGKFTPMVESSKCIGKTVCGTDEVLNYPNEYIQQLLTTVPPHIKHLLADDEAVHRQPPSNYNELDHLVRKKRALKRDDDDDEEYRQVCGSIKRTIAMAAAKNEENQWRFIVNTPEVPEMYSVEFCLSPESKCTIGSNVIENSTCRQKYISRQLLALNETGGIEPDYFRMPSVCACYYNKPQLATIL